MGVRAFSGLLVPLLAVLAACSGQTEVVPGIAHPAASASDGYPLYEGDDLHAFNDMSLVLPSGWQAQVSGACLAPPGEEASEASDPQDPSCPPAALRIRPEAARSGHIDPQGRSLDAADGWRRPETSCRTSGGGLEQEAEPVAVEPVERDRFTVVSGERVEVGEWMLTCADGTRFGTRIWYAPEVDVEFGVAAMADDVPREDYERVVRSLDFSRYAR
ncbi:hypothetical protein [Allosalinactinospora lopnorensis]|uniref:hypothetical protein n=1 Tax=Allosalinactinospora lopnorensis TaxID=1352348 RepID=UPI000623BB72|nr:hypothetical protein [Allosalinactinospora lopnorensis]